MAEGPFEFRSAPDGWGHVRSLSARPDDPDYSRLSPADRAFLERLRGAPALGSLSVEEERKRMRRDQVCVSNNFPVETEVFQTSACPVHIIRPRGVRGGAIPVTFYLHGGGWVLGDLQTHRKMVCELAVQSKRAVVFVEYPRAPEQTFPQPVEACVAAIAEVLSAADSLGLNAARFALAGDSSGGNLALAVVLASQQRGLALPARLVLLYPVTDYATDSPSYRQFTDDLNLGGEAMSWFWGHYLPDTTRRSDVLASPLRADRTALAGFPPTLLITCECDILRDQGESLASSLIEAGVEVTAVRWLGALHNFLITEFLSKSPSAESCMEFIAQYCRNIEGPTP
jgi:acetyl esterase